MSKIPIGPIDGVEIVLTIAVVAVAVNTFKFGKECATNTDTKAFKRLSCYKFG